MELIIIPEKFNEFLSVVALLFALVFSAICLRSNIHEASLKIIGITFITCLSLFANYWVVFFATVFIIATTITTTDFLEKLAAIIRGNKDYFDYKSAMQANQPFTKEHHDNKKAPINSDLNMMAMREETLVQAVDTTANISKPNIEAKDNFENKLYKDNECSTSISSETDLKSDFVEQAEWYRKNKRYDDAITAATEALTIDLKNSKALSIRAESYRILNRYDEAIRDATAALEIDSKNILALNARAECYRMLNRYDEAVRDATAALEIDSKNILAL